MAVTGRESGMDGVGRVPWGTHLCHFYRTVTEMADVLPAYLRAGLEGGEACLWAVSSPLEVDRAKAMLAGIVGGIDGYIATGQLEIADFTGWFHGAIEANADTAVAGLLQRHDQALARGFGGFRLVGSVPVLSPETRPGMSAREVALDAAIGGRRMLAVCSYSLDGLPAPDFADVVVGHTLSLLPRNDHWSLLRSADRHRAWEETLVETRDELQVRVAERTAQVETLNRQLRSMASQVSQAEENERRRIAVALHDRSNQTLAACVLKIATLARRSGSRHAAEALREIRGLLEQLARETRMLVFELSPPLLYDHGLEAALRELIRQTGEEHGITAVFTGGGRSKKIDSDLGILLYQSVRELIANVARHADAGRLAVSVGFADGEVHVNVEDDGIGFDVAALSDARQGGGFGLFSIRQRLGSVGGRMVVESDRRGTRVLLAAPVSGD